jgi:hypothetical protein
MCSPLGGEGATGTDMERVFRELRELKELRELRESM